MRIIVIGCGKVGMFLAEHLSGENHDVVVIDKDEEKIQQVQDTLDVMCIKGNGANAKTLIDAHVDRTDIVIATTAGDETNMLCCLISKQLGAGYTIARIRDPEFVESQMLLQQELGIDMAINPERATAQEISRLLRYPFAGSTESFARGHVEMVEYRAHEGDPYLGTPLKQFRHKLPEMPHVLYGIVDRKGSIIIPTGDFMIEPEDRVFVIGDPAVMTAYFRYLKRDTTPIRSMMILGGSRIAYYLAKTVIPMGVHTSILEVNPDKATELSELLPKADIILGDGTDRNVLEEQDLAHMDAFIGLCNRDEENLMTGMYAAERGVHCVIAKNSRDGYADILSRMGLDAVVSPKAITCAGILRYVRARQNSEGTAVEKLYRLLNGGAEALEFIARKGDAYIGIPLRDLTMRQNTLVGIIVHKNQVLVPFGNDKIEVGDHVVIITKDQGIDDLNDVLYR